MPCFHPIPAFRLSNGDVVFQERGDVVLSFKVSCGQCVGCRLERSRQWACRIMHESQLHDDNCFITLTYDDANVPLHNSLSYPDYQLFMKRLRKRFPHRTVRFYMAGEYGDQFGRPHFHACIFNLNFPDREAISKTPSGHIIYRSPVLENLWPHGYSSIGDLTFESAAYVARYVMKKVTGPLSSRHYEVVDTSTGEIIQRTPEFNRMSLKPGIGASWFSKYHKDVFPHDEVVVNGFPSKVPRYYDKLFDKLDPLALEEIKYYRELDARRFSSDNTPERLAVREQVAVAKLSQLKRNL